MDPTDIDLQGTMHLSWKLALAEEFKQPYFRQLSDFVAQERTTKVVYPPAGQVLRAFAVTPLDQVRVVILGQDPYHGPGQAHGLAFSVPPGVALPPSLRNVYAELRADLGACPETGDLTRWAEQGVLLLNTTLTVRQGEPASHQGQGWEQFTNAVIKILNAREKPMVFLLWGRFAQTKAAFIDTSRHVVLMAAHPSPLSATGFFGSKPFSKANVALVETGQEPVVWA